MCKKIIIFGFPHSGTTILRNIISHIENVYEIGFIYNDIIFDNSKYINKVQHGSHLTIPTECPSNLCHTEYRLFQINQPIKNYNSNINLTEIQHEILTTDINILEAYPENKLLMLTTNLV